MCNCLFCNEKVGKDKSDAVLQLFDSCDVHGNVILENSFRCIYDETNKCYTLGFSDDIPHMFFHKVIPTYIQFEWHNDDMLKYLSYNDPKLKSVFITFSFVRTDEPKKEHILLNIPLTFMLKFNKYKVHGSIMLLELNFDMFKYDKLYSLCSCDKCLSYYDVKVTDETKIFDKINVYFDFLFGKSECDILELNIKHDSLKSYYCDVASVLPTTGLQCFHSFDGMSGFTKGIYIEFFDEMDEDERLLCDNNISKIKSIQLYYKDIELISLHELKIKFKCRFITSKLIYFPFFDDALIDMTNCKIIMGYHTKYPTQIGIHFLEEQCYTI